MGRVARPYTRLALPCLHPQWLAIVFFADITGSSLGIPMTRNGTTPYELTPNLKAIYTPPKRYVHS
jgi:hypothetical protein